MTTHILSVIATVYGVYGSFAILLQAHQILIRHESCDVSMRFLVSYVIGYVIWFAYGLSSGSIPLVIVDGCGLVAGTVTTVLALAFHRACAPVGKAGK